MHRAGTAFLLLTVWAGSGAAVAQGGTDDPLRSQQWYLDTIRSPDPGSGLSAFGTLVAVLDTGVDANHPDLANVVRSGPDFNGGMTGADLNGHGTNVAGIIGAVGGNGVGIRGVAPDVGVLSIRVLDAQEQGTTVQVAKGIDAAIAAGAKVINLSLSPGTEAARTLNITDPLAPAMQRAVAAGVVVVAAAGNFALPLCAQPLAVTGILCVGAVNRELGLTTYTDFGVRVDVVAPGGDDVDPILSTAPGSRYAAYAGTSQATPQVAALAALLVAQGLPAQTVVQRIEQTARDLGPAGEDLQFGHGLIDVAAATGVSFPSAAPGSAPAPTTTSVTRSVSMTLTTPAALAPGPLLHSGAIVQCRSTLAGRCRVQMRKGHSVLARGERQVPARTPTNVRLHLTPRGRRLVRAARSVRVSITARGPHQSSAATSAVIRR